MSEKRQTAPESGYCQPDITILNALDEPLVFTEVVHTHPPEKSMAVAHELRIPLFVIAAPRETLVRPTLGAARPWWGLVPGLLDDETNREMASAYESYLESWIAAPADEPGHAQMETIVDDDARVVWSRFRGSAPDLDSPSYPTVGDAILADLLHLELRRGNGSDRGPGAARADITRIWLLIASVRDAEALRARSARPPLAYRSWRRSSAPPAGPRETVSFRSPLRPEGATGNAPAGGGRAPGSLRGEPMTRSGACMPEHRARSNAQGARKRG